MARSLSHGKKWNISNSWNFATSSVLPMFKASLRYKYALFHKEYYFLHYIFRLCMSNFYALVACLSDYLALYNPESYMSSDLLYLIFKTRNFDLLLHALKFRKGFYDGRRRI